MTDIFSIKDFQFPKDFILGSGGAGHQIEGNNVHSQLWFEELAEGSHYSEPSALACNGYELYETDARLLSELSQKAYRMSIEWSRIEPSEGQICREEIDHYKKVLESLVSKGIKPFITILHFSWPKWFEDLGAFNKRENMGYFLRHVELIAEEFSQYAFAWNVINEFNFKIGSEFNEQKKNYMFAHAGAYHIIKKYSKAPVGTAHAYMSYYPYRRKDPMDQAMTELLDWEANEFFFEGIRSGEVILPYCDSEKIDGLKDSVDFWAINTYTRTMVDSRVKSTMGKRYDHKELKMIDMDFYLEEMQPEILMDLTRLKDKPIIITENGCCCNDDRFRIVYMTLYLSALNELMKSGVRVDGYLYWSFMDNYEWGSYLPRFGLLDVDFKTFERTPKPSALFYRDIIENNGFSQEILRKYLDVMPSLKGDSLCK